MNEPDQVPARETRTLAEAIELVRAYARHEGHQQHTRVFDTADGTMTIDYKADEYLKITFAGDAPARTYLRPHDWNGE